MSNKICCEPFKQLIHQINWFSSAQRVQCRDTNDDGEKIILMPCFIGSDGNKYRINHCPTCGADVRQLKFTETEFINLLQNDFV
jgi:hypothetical protein